MIAQIYGTQQNDKYIFSFNWTGNSKTAIATASKIYFYDTFVFIILHCEKYPYWVLNMRNFTIPPLPRWTYMNHFRPSHINVIFTTNPSGKIRLHTSQQITRYAEHSPKPNATHATPKAPPSQLLHDQQSTRNYKCYERWLSSETTEATVTIWIISYRS